MITENTYVEVFHSGENGIPTEDKGGNRGGQGGLLSNKSTDVPKGSIMNPPFTENDFQNLQIGDKVYLKLNGGRDEGTLTVKSPVINNTFTVEFDSNFAFEKDTKWNISSLMISNQNGEVEAIYKSVSVTNTNDAAPAYQENELEPAPSTECDDIIYRYSKLLSYKLKFNDCCNALFGVTDTYFYEYQVPTVFYSRVEKLGKERTPEQIQILKDFIQQDYFDFYKLISNADFGEIIAILFRDAGLSAATGYDMPVSVDTFTDICISFTDKSLLLNPIIECERIINIDKKLCRMISLEAIANPQYFQKNWLKPHLDFIFNYVGEIELGNFDALSTGYNFNAICNETRSDYIIYTKKNYGSGYIYKRMNLSEMTNMIDLYEYDISYICSEIWSFYKDMQNRDIERDTLKKMPAKQRDEYMEYIIELKILTMQYDV